MLSIPGGSHDEDGVKSDPKLQSSLMGKSAHSGANEYMSKDRISQAGQAR